MSAYNVATSLVRQFESCELKAYPDPATGGAPWTIGWGATGPGIQPGTVWTQQMADNRLRADVTEFVDGVRSSLKRSATDNQLGAMASLAYNVGLKNFRGSTLLKLFNAGDITGAAAQFPRWNRAAGKVMKGLTRRREAERAVFLRGEG
jgi:lysozyme